ncbi:helix-turn-helix transcriptional regulator [Hymenobacter busanensis]|uniref:Helix-turn-helix transcriptional regulator n=1 Tax=Hymenobacter busanensis TaxID=2607656 RepID=A0A7L4ZYH7_9BACT|nr:helix-turn-helix domain-containing protein [Hymenobacter busanensis]KAA9333047.1 helix-turn-helix transcriptional regulator [Hymenobacter busanensis]QHJ08278.1 transcriptional regulator [Hymenobacter busanensis]
MENPIDALVKLIKGKHKADILMFLNPQPRRFSEVRRHLGRVSERILTKQLRELEAEGLVRREVFPEVPPRVEYSLTAHGYTLCPVLKQMWYWGRQHNRQKMEAPVAV